MEYEMRKITILLIAVFLASGCSSGGGTTSSGDGSGIQTTPSNLLLSAMLTVNDSVNVTGSSVDLFVDLCNAFAVAEDPDTEPVFEDPITTVSGTMTVMSNDLMDTSGLTLVEIFPEGVTFNRYEVSFTVPDAPNSSAPRLPRRIFRGTFTLLNGTATGSVRVILMDLDTTIPEFLRLRQGSGSIISYNVKVTLMGAELNGQPIRISAETFLEVGNFDRC